MRFEIKAVKSPAGLTRFALDAADETDARQQALAKGYVVLDVKVPRAAAAARSRFPLLMFSQELIALLNAGLGLIEALQTLSERHQEGQMHTVVQQVLEHLFQGQTFSAALERCAASFPPLYIATVRASEKTGNLPQALSRYIAYQLQVEALRSKLMTASIYPALLIVVGGVVILFLLGYVVPKFASIYADLGREQPWSTQLLMQFGTLLNEHAGVVAAIAAALVAALAIALLDAPRRARIGEHLVQLPVVGDKLRIVQLARFYRTTGMLLSGGVPVVPALEMVGDLLQPGLRDRLGQAIREVREGKPLSRAMSAHGLTTPVALRMLRVGERTGEMGTMMERIAAFHDEEIAHWIDRFMRLFEPLLMTAIGIIIGVIVLSLYMPIFELAGSLQ
ncbi:MAG TPA: type II secretion system F family protein [Burkholderiales bacterium]|nr:type II secretion system F family protein [Burkholderiales bacterium]